MNNSHVAALYNFKNCVQDAPDGCYADAKQLDSIVGSAIDDLIKSLRSVGLRADNCDLAYDLEARVYDYVKCSNPNSDMFALAEGFGSAVEGPARDRVIFQAKRDRDFIFALIHADTAPDS